MLNLFISFFKSKDTENTIAASIEIKEMSASTWWS